MRFRRFRNADVPAITQLWNAHHMRMGSPVAPITFNHFQTAVLDRQTFSSEQTLVAEDASGAVVGFAHFPFIERHSESPTVSSKSQLEAGGRDQAAVSSHGITSNPEGGKQKSRGTLVCFLWSHKAEPEFGIRFLDEVCSFGVRRCGLTITHRVGYVGLSPDVGLAGVVESEPELIKWLISKGYRRAEQWQIFSLALANFRIPVDRVLMALRRSAVFEEIPVDGIEESLYASGWGHLDPLGFALKHRGNVIATVSAWVSGLGSGMEALIEPVRIRENAPDGAELMLLSETIRELSLRRIECVRTATPADQELNIDRWKKLGFCYQSKGSVFVRD